MDIKSKIRQPHDCWRGESRQITLCVTDHARALRGVAKGLSVVSKVNFPLCLGDGESRNRPPKWLQGYPLQQSGMAWPAGSGFFYFSLLLSRRELGDTQVYEPQIRALLGTATHFCEVVVLRSRTVPNGLGFRILRLNSSGVMPGGSGIRVKGSRGGVGRKPLWPDLRSSVSQRAHASESPPADKRNPHIQIVATTLHSYIQITKWYHDEKYRSRLVP